LKPIRDFSRAQAGNLRYVLMDIDDTLTRDGKLHPEPFAALWALRMAGLYVIPVTGRPAGWCDCIARQWPVDGIVGENGALAFWEEPSPKNDVPARLRQEFHPQAVRNDHPVLEKIRQRALAEIPGLRVAKDQFSRMFDLALDFAEEDPVLPLSDAVKIRDLAEQEGGRAKISSIHVNVWMGDYDKLSMAEGFLQRRFGWNAETEADQVVFVGDSPNDEPLFARFPLSCAVANIRRYGDLIKHPPAFVASAECGAGFAEIANILIEKRA